MSVESAKQALQKREEISGFPAILEKFKTEIANALPEHLRVNMPRYLRLALSEFRNNPKLGECDPRSVFAAVIRASQLGLELGVLGQAYLVPYGNQAQMVPGWKGYVSLVHRSGNAVVWTGTIYTDQKYEFRAGSQNYLRVLNESELMEDSDIKHTFAVGIVKGMEDHPIIELWPTEKTKKHRDRFNKVGNRHYSYQNWEQYARKVPLLQVVKYLPASVELSSLVALEYAAETGEQPQGYTIDAIQEGLFTPNSDNKNAPEVSQTTRTEATIEVKAESKAEPVKSTIKTTPAKETPKKTEPKPQAKKQTDSEPPWMGDNNSPEKDSPVDIEGDSKPTAKAAAVPIPEGKKGQVKRGVEFPFVMTIQDGVGESYTPEQLETAEGLCKALNLPSADAAISKWLKEDGGKGQPVKRENMTSQAMAKFIELLEVLKK